MNPRSAKPLRTLVLGGLLPVIAFTVAESYLGIVWGVIIGMVFAVWEISFEWFRDRRVSPITLGGGAMILVLGGVSLLTQEGLWFKLQPAILEFVMGGVLLGSVLLKKPLMVVMAREQGMLERMRPDVRPLFEEQFAALTFRLSLFFFLHTGLAVWSALEWSTKNWALLKGVGFTGSMILYMLVEMLFLRKRIRQKMVS